MTYAPALRVAQGLLRYICENGSDHVAVKLSAVTSATHEAVSRHLGWQMYWHRT